MNFMYKEIPDARTWTNIKQIYAGWSSDKKYYIQTNDDREMLLRLADIMQHDRKKLEFESVERLKDTDIRIPRPVDFGICDEGKSVYSLYTWVEGQDAKEAIPKLSCSEQYRLGLKSGEILKAMHEIPVLNRSSSWAERYNLKIDRYIANYSTCGIHFKGAEQVLNYIETHRFLLESRPMTFQHGDYHVGNMVVSSSGELGIIDFNRLDDGDPWEEFNRITWCANESAEFASGRIHGYFHGEVPESFFKLMALYIACNQIASVPWSIPYGESQVNYMLEQVEQVLDWYNGFEISVPSWYLPS
ncbi:aminoglycoside phosphotransferase family protein [Paenibacillus lentus]|uniref:Phosphotransferase family protein n=1 Tax=Paenibacillus lentus TaxID=1338368 RepID=A0A3S8RYP3_9BACL|nr:phosphotransferase family protein [Paenibacillus lentus]AZK48062.1 phosphotransferase family protein [Paenibacillus lentus]